MPRRRRQRRRFPRSLVLLATAAAAAAAIALARPPKSAPRVVAEPAPTAARHTALPLSEAPAPPTAAAVGAIPSAVPSTAAAPAPSGPSAPPVSPRPSLPPPSPTGRPRLAIIIDDCGQWPQTEGGFVALSVPLTLSVLPHVRYSADIARAADAAGKGVMLHLPMETVSGRDPGPGTITTAMDDAAIRREVTSDLAEIPFVRGVNNHEGSRATADTRVMGDVMTVLAQQGRFFVDSRTSSATVGESVAREHGVLAARRSVFLDNEDRVDAIEAQLRQAAALARSSGSAIAIGHPRAATLQAVRELVPELTADGIDFTLAADLVH